MRYPLCAQVAAIIYNGSFNATATGPISDQVAHDSLMHNIDKAHMVAAEQELSCAPEIYLADYREFCRCTNPVVELFAEQWCKYLGLD